MHLKVTHVGWKVVKTVMLVRGSDSNQETHTHTLVSESFNLPVFMSHFTCLSRETLIRVIGPALVPSEPPCGCGRQAEAA